MEAADKIKVVEQYIEAFATGDTYPFPPDITEEDAYRAWMIVPAATFVAEEGGEILGT